MKQRAILAGLILLAWPGIIQVQPLEIQVHYGPWTLSPFKSMAEEYSERLIEEEVKSMVEPILPVFFHPDYSQDFHLSSSGQFLSLSLLYHLKNRKFAVGVKTIYSDFRLPFRLSTTQSFDILGFPLARTDTQASGHVKLQTLILSLLGKWNIFSGRTFVLSAASGITLFPFVGHVSLQQTTTITTLLGSYTYEDSEEETIDQFRREFGIIPGCILSPLFSLSLKIRLWKKTGLSLDATLSQGTYLSGGLFLEL
jgi:hypothetical protein